MVCKGALLVLAALSLLGGAGYAQSEFFTSGSSNFMQHLEEDSAEQLRYTPQQEDQIVADWSPPKGCTCPDAGACPCKAPEPEPRCPVGVIEKDGASARCVPTRYTDELEVRIYSKRHSPGNEPIVELQMGHRTPTQHVVNGEVLQVPWIGGGTQTLWAVLPNRLYTIYVWREPSGHKCPTRTVFTRRGGSFAHAGMRC